MRRLITSDPTHLVLRRRESIATNVFDGSDTNLCSTHTSFEMAAANRAIGSGKVSRIHEEMQITSACGRGDSEVKTSSSEEEGEVVCSMCGDVGIAELLFLCSKCSHHHQHIYCSRSYPDIGALEVSVCNWCLHAEDASVAKTSRAHTILVELESTPVAEPSCSRMSLLDVEHLTDHALKEEEEEEGERTLMTKKGQSKAFEYLLLVAAVQSLPSVHEVISNANPEVNRHGVRALTLPAMASSTKASTVGKNSSTDMDIKVGTSSTLTNLVHRSPLAGKTNTSLITERVDEGRDKSQSTRIHGPLQINIDPKSGLDVGRFIGGGIIPRRQRYPDKGMNGSSLKCRKKGFQLSPSRQNYRRYKLLADVVC